MSAERNAQAWRAAVRATRVHPDPGAWRTRLAAHLYAATRGTGVTHLTVVTCVRDRPDLCDYGYYPKREVALGELVFSRIMPRLLAECRAQWDEGVRRYGPIVPVFEVFGGGPPDGPFRRGCAAASIECALLGGFWVDSRLVGYLMIAGSGDEKTLLARLGPDLERVVADTEKTLAFVARLNAEMTRAEEDTGAAASELSKRERDVAALAAEGYSDTNIAARLRISEGTVGAHLHRIYRKLGVHNRIGLAQRLGLSRPLARDSVDVSGPHVRAGLAFTRVGDVLSNGGLGDEDR